MIIKRVVNAYARSIPRLFSGPVILLGLTSVGAGLLLWGVILTWVAPAFLAWLSHLTHWRLDGFWGFLLFMLLSFPLVFLVGLLLLSLLAVRWLRGYLRRRHGYVSRPTKGHLSLSRQILESVWVTSLGIALWLLSLLLFWAPPLPLLLSLASVAWVQYRLVALDVWGETESPATFRALRAKHRGEGLVLSLGLAAFSMIPLLNLALPVLSALVFLQWDQELQKDSGA